MIENLTGATIRCDCGRRLTPSGGEHILHCVCGRIWQALVQTRTTGATAWIPSRRSTDRRMDGASVMAAGLSAVGASAARRAGSPVFSVLRSIPGRISQVPVRWPERGCGRVEGGAEANWRPKLV